MRILLVNPNTSTSVTDRLEAVGRSVASAGTTIKALTAPRGFPYLSSRAEAQIGGAIVLDMIAEEPEPFDVAIIAAFGDPGLMAARELFDQPIIGMSEAAMLTACMLGSKFSLVTFANALKPWFEECVAMHGLTDRCASVRSLAGGFKSISDVQEEKEAALIALATAAVEEDGAEVVVLAGAPLAGLAAKVRDQIPVPLVDQVAAAVKQAEAIAALSPRKATAGSFARTGAKPSFGLGASLANRISRTDG